MKKAKYRRRQLRPRQGMRKFLTLILFLALCGCTERRQASLLQTADDKIAQAKYSEGTELLRRAISMNPESKSAVRALYKLGFALESYLKDYEGALFNYQEFIRLSQDRVSIYEVQKRIANIYFEQYRESDKSIAAYKKLISFNPESLETDLFQFRIASAYFRLNNFEQARYEYQQLLERFPRSQYTPRVRFEIGNAYYMEGKYDIAIEALKQVMRHHSQSEYAIEAQFLMAQCYENSDRLQNALQIYENIQGRYTSPEVLAIRIAELKKRIAKRK